MAILWKCPLLCKLGVSPVALIPLHASPNESFLDSANLSCRSIINPMGGFELAGVGKTKVLLCVFCLSIDRFFIFFGRTDYKIRRIFLFLNIYYEKHVFLLNILNGILIIKIIV